MNRASDSDSAAVAVERFLPFAPEEVFEAWLDPRAMGRWLQPAPDTRPASVQLDPVVGGVLRITMDVDGTSEQFVGRYVAIEPPRRIVFTWRGVRTEDAETEVSVELDPHGTGTVVRIVHRRLPTPASREAHAHGWGHILATLAGHLATDSGRGGS